MQSQNLKYKNVDGSLKALENWMCFSIELGGYLKQLSQPIKIYISVPSNLLFSYFFVFGAVDYDFKNPSTEALLDQYLNLKKGQRILYKTGDDWVAHSVIEVSHQPNSDTRAILVKDRLDSINYIPETRWFNYVRIHDDDITTVRNTRLVRNVYNIIDNEKLKKFYSEEKLQLLMMQNTPQTYVYANKKEWKDFLDVIKLNLDGDSFQLSELLFDGSESTFKNLAFIEQNRSVTIPKEAIAIFVGSSRALRKMDDFDEHKCVFIIDQYDSNEKFEDLQFKIEQDFLMSQSHSVNKEILEYMDGKHVEIPKGVEIFAWLS
ncbi:hypothetical protein [Viridibacillus arvi]|uniref:Uncharacterized protein n=1 Tax=Viridibacillus arvi TaxID=263475 RepID=A0A0M0LAA8_9BACL|nr:hypothetical protein [Viridibacillus arvi]KOO47807.1 hypothetical protein AMD00_19415 [Viridibacillus arvi]